MNDNVIKRGEITALLAETSKNNVNDHDRAMTQDDVIDGGAGILLLCFHVLPY
jgi:hypothetical protein